MGDTELKSLLEKLHAELEAADHVDPEARELVAQLGGDIDRLLAPGVDFDNPDSAIELAQALEAQFEARHPVAARFLQEIISTLGKLGI